MKKVEKNFSALNFRINIHYFTLFYLTLLLLLKIKGYFCIAEPDKLPDRHISTDQSIDTEKIQNIHILKSNLKIYFFPYEIMQPWSVENVALMVIDFCSVLFFFILCITPAIYILSDAKDQAPRIDSQNNYFFYVKIIQFCYHFSLFLKPVRH